MTTNKNKPGITPDTKVANLLKEFPQAEELLKHFSPAFAALKNPVSRKTVAKATSLQQAAKERLQRDDARSCTHLRGEEVICVF